MSRVVVFGFDVAEASQIRTVRWLQGAGCTVESFSFRRDNMNADFTPDWPDVCLGHQSNGGLIARALHLPVAALRLVRHRAALRRAEAIVARNLDLTLLALFARWVSGARAPVIYQCLDIHDIFTRPGWKGAVARWGERWALARIDRLVVSSPGFLRHYFEPVQGFGGDALLVENKIWWPAAPIPRPCLAPRPPGPLRLGWVGTLRCPDSLELLAAAAEHFGDRIEVILRGVVHRHNLPGFDDILRAHPNIRLEGAYSYPDGLAGAYDGLDLVWAQDLWQRGRNSDWLLPNRIYEAGYFGVPCLAVDGTETGRRVAADGGGFTIDRARPEAMIAALTALGFDDLRAARARLLERCAAHYSLSAQQALGMLDFGRNGPEALDVAPA